MSHAVADLPALERHLHAHRIGSDVEVNITTTEAAPFVSSKPMRGTSRSIGTYWRDGLTPRHYGAN